MSQACAELTITLVHAARTLQAGTANIKFKPLLESSEPVVVTYNIPFGLNVGPQGGRAV